MRQLWCYVLRGLLPFINNERHTADANFDHYENVCLSVNRNVIKCNER